MLHWKEKLQQAKDAFDSGEIDQNRFQQLRDQIVAEMKEENNSEQGSAYDHDTLAGKTQVYISREEPVHSEEEMDALAGKTGTWGEKEIAVAEDSAQMVPVGIGTQMGQYTILEEIGAGGMGAVYRARHSVEAFAQQTGDVAIKVMGGGLSVDPSFVARFITEAGLGRSIRHPNFVAIHDVIVEEKSKTLALVMDLVEGVSLSQMVATKPMALHEALPIIQELCSALDYIHSKGIVHRDIKPDNIIITPSGSPVILDMGIAKNTKQPEESKTSAGVAMGTPLYMAPEQLDAQNVTGAADRYALGLVVYQMLSGRLPWQKGLGQGSILAKKFTEDFLPLAEQPEYVHQAVMKILARDVSERWETCALFFQKMQEPAMETETDPENEYIQEDIEVEQVETVEEVKQRLYEEMKAQFAQEQAISAEKLRLEIRAELEAKANKEEPNYTKIDGQDMVEPPSPDTKPQKIPEEKQEPSKNTASSSISSASSSFETVHPEKFQNSATSAKEMSPTPQDTTQKKSNLWWMALVGMALVAGWYVFPSTKSQTESQTESSTIESPEVAIEKAKTIVESTSTKPKKDTQSPSVAPSKKTSTSSSSTSATNEKPKTDVVSTTEQPEDLSHLYNVRTISHGSFMMGCADEDSAICDKTDSLQHNVEITKTFYMMDSEVTQELYEKVMGSNPSHTVSLKHPVESVSWFQAVEFANKLNEKEGRESCYLLQGSQVTWTKTCTGWRLPTEAEWEYAARGTTQQIYAGGDDPDSVAWYNANSNKQTHPVKSKAKNSYGLYDMSGNVWEWVWDWYGPYSVTVNTNPLGPKSGNTRVMRGGAMGFDVKYTQVSRRYSYDPSKHNNTIGFRLLRFSAK